MAKVESLTTKRDNPLPTIGTEVEFPPEDVAEEAIRVANGLHIPSYEEATGEWELRPKFTYSALGQSRILMEMVKLGAMDLDYSRETGLRHAPPQKMLSLHMNLGLPPFRFPSHSEYPVRPEQLEKKFHNDFELLDDMITYAFSSASRLAGRKTSSSYYVQSSDVQKSEKNSQEVSSANLRLELRAIEFRDFPTFIMLEETQRIAATMFSSFKRRLGMDVTPQEEQLADLWDEYYNEAQITLDQFTDRRKLYDTSAYDAVELMQTTSIKQSCRKVNDKYFVKIGELLEK